jgi:hypothetical protein
MLRVNALRVAEPWRGDIKIAAAKGHPTPFVGSPRNPIGHPRAACVGARRYSRHPCRHGKLIAIFFIFPPTKPVVPETKASVVARRLRVRAEVLPKLVPSTRDPAGRMGGSTVRQLGLTHPAQSSPEPIAVALSMSGSLPDGSRSSKDDTALR